MTNATLIAKNLINSDILGVDAELRFDFWVAYTAFVSDLESYNVVDDLYVIRGFYNSDRKRFVEFSSPLTINLDESGLVVSLQFNDRVKHFDHSAYTLDQAVKFLKSDVMGFLMSV